MTRCWPSPELCETAALPGERIPGNLSSPPLLFYFPGSVAVPVRSDPEIPAKIAWFLSLYLLFAIGFKDGMALSGASMDSGARTS